MTAWRLPWPVLSVLAAAVLFAGFLLGDAMRPESPESGGGRSEAEGIGGDFTLLGPGGRPVSLADFRGAVVMLYFGYTHCPDLCPAYLHAMKTLHQELGPDASALRVVLVSLDPERDTPERLAEYVEFFHESFVGLTGPRDTLDEIVAAYGAAYRIGTDDGSGSYLVDHTSLGYLIDGDGVVRHLLAHGTPVEEQLPLVRDLIAKL